jgi:hypothetical protein
LLYDPEEMGKVYALWCARKDVPLIDVMKMLIQHIKKLK